MFDINKLPNANSIAPAGVITPEAPVAPAPVTPAPAPAPILDVTTAEPVALSSIPAPVPMIEDVPPMSDEDLLNAGAEIKETEIKENNINSDVFVETLLNSKGYGSAQPNVSTSDIENILINDITEDNLKKLYEIIKPIYEKIISNSEEILNLEQLRDTLLPKMMNGEIDLDNIEI